MAVQINRTRKKLEMRDSAKNIEIGSEFAESNVIEVYEDDEADHGAII